MYLLDCNTIALNVFMKSQLLYPKIMKMYPPEIIIDHSKTDNGTEFDNMFRTAEYQFNVLRMDSRFQMMPVSGTIVIYPKRIVNFLNHMFDGDSLPPIIVYAILVHDILHEYMHHACASYEYRRYIKQYRYAYATHNKALLDDSYNHYTEYVRDACTAEMELRNEDCTLTVYPKIVKALLFDMNNADGPYDFSQYEKVSNVVTNYYKAVQSNRLSKGSDRDVEIACNKLNDLVSELIKSGNADTYAIM